MQTSETIVQSYPSMNKFMPKDVIFGVISPSEFSRYMLDQAGKVGKLNRDTVLGIPSFVSISV